MTVPSGQVEQWSGPLPANQTPFTIFPAATAASATATFNRPETVNALRLRMDLTGFSGTLDIQGRPSDDAEWANIEYVLQAETNDASVAQITYTLVTGSRDYVVPSPSAQMRAVMTRSAGSIEGYAEWDVTGIGGAGGGAGGETVTANQGTKTATATNGWLVTPFSASGTALFPTAEAMDDSVAAAPVTTQVGAIPLLFTGSSNIRQYSAGGTSDGTSGVANPAMMPYRFNGATFDRVRNNLAGTLLASAARTATTSSADQTNYNGRGCHVIIKVTAITDTPSVVPEIQGKDAVTGDYYAILTGVALTGTGTTVLKVYPGITALANGAASDMLPRTWRVNFTAADTDSMTYSAAYAVNL